MWTQAQTTTALGSYKKFFATTTNPQAHPKALFSTRIMGNFSLHCCISTSCTIITIACDFMMLWLFLLARGCHPFAYLDWILRPFRLAEWAPLGEPFPTNPEDPPSPQATSALFRCLEVPFPLSVRSCRTGTEPRIDDTRFGSHQLVSAATAWWTHT